MDLFDFQKKLEHILVAYKYCFSSIPQPSMFVHGSVKVGDFYFKTDSQALSMRVELGWAFFTRLESCFEAFLKDNFNQEKVTKDFLSKNKIWDELTKHEQEGVQIYRELRNTFHHGDGNASLLRKPPKFLKIEDRHEPHLMPDQIREFYSLFIKVAKLLSS